MIHAPLLGLKQGGGSKRSERKTFLNFSAPFCPKEWRVCGFLGSPGLCNSQVRGRKFAKEAGVGAGSSFLADDYRGRRTWTPAYPPEFGPGSLSVFLPGHCSAWLSTSSEFPRPPPRTPDSCHWPWWTLLQTDRASHTKAGRPGKGQGQGQGRRRCSRGRAQFTARSQRSRPASSAPTPACLWGRRRLPALRCPPSPRPSSSASSSPTQAPKMSSGACARLDRGRAVPGTTGACRRVAAWAGPNPGDRDRDRGPRARAGPVPDPRRAPPPGPDPARRGGAAGSRAGRNWLSALRRVPRPGSPQPWREKARVRQPRGPPAPTRPPGLLQPRRGSAN